MEKESYIIFQQLQKVGKLNKDSAYEELKTIFNGILRNHETPFVSKEKYKIKVSIGQGGNVAKYWWCGVFDIPFYKKFYGILNKSSIGASKGYYIAYLFNEEKNEVYLSLNQAAKDIHKNKEKLINMMIINDFFREKITNDNFYLINIHKCLSSCGNDLGEDYENGNILAIKYDLKGKKISDKVFYDDIKKMSEAYDILKTILLESKGQIKIKTEIYNVFFKEKEMTNEFDNEEEYINESYGAKKLSIEEAKVKGNRKVQYTNKNGVKRVKTDAKLRKFVLDNFGYKCQYDGSHQTFVFKEDKQYMEVHHLIPLSFQSQFGNDFNLDRIENLVVVCPNCHKALHYGIKEEKEKVLRGLYERPEVKEMLTKDPVCCGSFEDFFERFYSNK